jgi:hypothetical protein
VTPRLVLCSTLVNLHPNTLPSPHISHTLTSMADSGDFYAESVPEDAAADVDMAEDAIPVVEIDSAIPATATTTEPENGENENTLPFQDEAMEEVPARVTYIDYLKSPVIGLLVGQGDEQALLTAHQALLTQSPWFADACAKFSDEVSVSSHSTFYSPNTNL